MSNSVFKLNNSKVGEESSSEALKPPGPHIPTHPPTHTPEGTGFFSFPSPPSALQSVLVSTDLLHVWVSSPPVNVFLQQLILSEGSEISLLLSIML